jgi:hypothetical protein
VGYEVAGWLGAVLVLVAYWDVTTHGTSLHYHVMNLLGAAGLLINALHHDALPSSAVNIVWAFIAIWGMRRTPLRGRPATG